MENNNPENIKTEITGNIFSSDDAFNDNTNNNQKIVNTNNHSFSATISNSNMFTSTPLKNRNV